MTAIVAALGDLVQVIRDADPADKADLYAQLGLTLTYRPQKRLVEASVTPSLHVCKSLCPRGDLNPETGAIYPDRGNHAIRVTRRGRAVLSIQTCVRYLVFWLDGMAGYLLCWRLGWLRACAGRRSRGRYSRVRVWRVWRRGRRSVRLGKVDFGRGLVLIRAQDPPMYWAVLPLFATGATRISLSRVGSRSLRQSMGRWPRPGVAGRRAAAAGGRTPPRGSWLSSRLKG
jgi:hypothetical protein